MNYKKCKPAKELISHLGTEKSVDFIETTKEKAEEILIRNNYINVITPFKHHFADLDENGANKYESIRDDEGRHIYIVKDPIFLVTMHCTKQSERNI
ncbi:hypothetical protein PT197_01495 [Erysipelothrix rhusiopathiae]|nr:hypothetical protein [Erysipelothrix rhusiopathiae]